MLNYVSISACLKALQLIMISDNNHNIERLLLLTIIDSGKKYKLLTNKISQLPIPNRQLIYLNDVIWWEEYNT